MHKEKNEELPNRCFSRFFTREQFLPFVENIKALVSGEISEEQGIQNEVALRQGCVSVALKSYFERMRESGHLKTIDGLDNRGLRQFSAWNRIVKGQEQEGDWKILCECIAMQLLHDPLYCLKKNGLDKNIITDELIDESYWFFIGLVNEGSLIAFDNDYCQITGEYIFIEWKNWQIHCKTLNKFHKWIPVVAPDPSAIPIGFSDGCGMLTSSPP
jgi:hypothetical protein